MADYWKSNPRKYCEVCKCWFGDNEASVSFHEQGRRHKANVERQLREARSNASEAEKDRKKTEAMLASIEHAALSAYHKDLTGEESDKPKKKTIRPLSEEEEHQRKVLGIASTIAYEKRKEVEKHTIKENIEKKMQQLKQESMAWQPLISPEGYTYYYNTMTGVTQWEPPTGYAPQPHPYYTQPNYTHPTTHATTTINHHTSHHETDSNTSAPKRLPPQETGDDGPTSPKRSRASGPYGGWQTVAEYTVEEPTAESAEQEAEGEEEKEKEVEFEEKTLPVKETEPEGREYSGGFKKFSFKKRGSGKAQIRQRTTKLS